MQIVDAVSAGAIVRIFLLGMPGCGNYGDDLISCELLARVKRRWSTAEIGVACGRFDFPRDDAPAVQYFALPPKRQLAKYLAAQRQIKSFLRTADIFVLGGGGLLQDTHGAFNIHGYLRYMRHLRPEAIRVMCGVGVGPIRHAFNRRYLASMLPCFDDIELRDDQSANIVLSMADVKVVVTADLIASAPAKIPNRDPAERVLGISIRPWENISVRQASQLIEAAIKILRPSTVCFFVFEYGEGYSEEADFAREIMAEFAGSSITHVLLCYGETPRDLFESYLGRVHYAIASRFHANVIWQKHAVPCLPLPYAPKIRSLYLDKGIEIGSTEEVLARAERGSLGVLDFRQIELPTQDGLSWVLERRGRRSRLKVLLLTLALDGAQWICESAFYLYSIFFRAR